MLVDVQCVLLLVNRVHQIVYNIGMPPGPVLDVFSHGTNVKNMVCCLFSITQGANIGSRFLPTFEVCLAGEGVNAGI